MFNKTDRKKFLFRKIISRNLFFLFFFFVRFFVRFLCDFAHAIADLQLLLENVHNEIVGKEVRLCASKQCSPVMEEVLRRSSPVLLRNFAANLEKK